VGILESGPDITGKTSSNVGAKKKNPLPRFATGSGFETFVVILCYSLIALSLGIKSPARRPVPMMIGTMVQMVAMMGSTESHLLLVHSLNNRSYT
jgi:hypothetical protein